ncbi:serpin family protein [Paenibacillus chibensis]|uniref:Serpin family protein n=1 Tax=Paenibacillus chibensis TaxID=59846 RepID=A0ABU6PT57_9BACL|nr:serpin family protein [Paenibacillus chibensis]
MNGKKTCISILLYCSLLVLPACSAAKPDGAAKEQKVLSLSERSQIASQLDPAFIQAHNQFGLRLHHELQQQSEAKGKNIVLSPYSIFTDLAIAYNGSVGITGQEMSRALGMERFGKEQVNLASRTLQTLLMNPSSGVQLNVANSVWYQSEMGMKDDYIQTIQDSYQADMEAVDFGQKKTVGKINTWVSKQTKGLIPSILDQAPDPLTKAILLNSVYFNGAWQNPFDPDETREGLFTTADGTKQKARMMIQSGRFEYMQTVNAQALRLPYGDGRLDMLIILPGKGSSLEQVMEEIRQDPARWQKRFEQSPGDIRLPRFQTDYSTSLKKPLMQMGMKQAFAAEADFTGMSDKQPLFISNVLHKTVLDVSEKGTVAAAVTEIGMAGSAPPPQERFEMTMDHPFFFSIEDSQTGLWLFLGTIESL